MRFKQEGWGESGLALVALVCCGIGCTGKDKTVDSGGPLGDEDNIHLEKLLACGYPQVCEDEDIFRPPMQEGAEWTENQKCILTALAGNGPFMLHGAVDGVRADGDYIAYEAYELVGADRSAVSLSRWKGEDAQLRWSQPTTGVLKEPEWFVACLEDTEGGYEATKCMTFAGWHPLNSQVEEVRCP